MAVEIVAYNNVATDLPFYQSEYSYCDFSFLCLNETLSMKQLIKVTVNQLSTPQLPCLCSDINGNLGINISN